MIKFKSVVILGLICVIAACSDRPRDRLATGDAFTAIDSRQLTQDGQMTTRLVIETTAPIEQITSLILLDAPYRLVLDVAGASWQVSGLAQEAAMASAGLAGYRFGRHPDKRRLVFDLTEPLVPIGIYSKPPSGDGRYRLVIELQNKGHDAFHLEKEARAKSPFIAPPPKELSDEMWDEISGAKHSTKFVVVVDAGHGGIHDGAKGNGIIEKDVTLKAAQILVKKLNETGHIRAILTRRDDREVGLKERVTIARRARAGLFISLHADAPGSPNPQANGMTIFTLSETGAQAYRDSRRAGQALAVRQNQTMKDSVHLAGVVLQQVKDLPIHDSRRGHRYAAFEVLKSPDIPSILVEMGFLTNPSDAHYLRQDAYLERLAGRLTRAIMHYRHQTGH